jgi:hypothetical protein
MLEHTAAAAARESDSVRPTPSAAQLVNEIVETEDKQIALELAGRFSARRSIALIGSVSLLLWVAALVSVRYV